MTVGATIIKKLNDTFDPFYLNVADESHLHEGHAGSREGGETHFRILVVSAQFIGQSRLARQRLLNSCLSAELEGRVHALAMQAQTPDEYESK